MSAARTGVFPCRKDKGVGWHDCAEHKATSWSAEHKGKVIGRYVTKGEAQGQLNITVSKTKRPSGYSLGSRMGPPRWS
jgi:hypothetical protein